MNATRIMIILSGSLLMAPAPSPSTPKVLSDADLIVRVRSVVQKKLPASKAAEAVGQRPWIDTTRSAHDRSALRGATIGNDDSMHGESTPFADNDVVYWGRPVSSENPRIVGIVWRKDSPRLFFGILYPP